MISTGLKIVAVLVALLVLAVFLAWRFQHRVAFPGPRGPLPAPATVGIPDGELIEVTTGDGVTLRGWYLPPSPAPPEGEAPALLWFYGNMETIGGIAPVLREFRPPGIAMLVLDYRGYGQSGGKPTEQGVYRDADAAWRYISSRPGIDSTRVAVYGRSIGSAVALYLATEYPVSAVVLESPFTSGRDMAEEHYAPVPSVLVELELDNLSRASKLTVPLLVFHGSDDWIAPLPMGRAVAEAGHAEEFVVIEGAGHNDTYAEGGEEYRRRLHEFLREHLF